MTTLTDINSGERYSGRAPESIARRVWGRRAALRDQYQSAMVPAARVALVVEPVGGEGREFRVLATVAVES